MIAWTGDRSEGDIWIGLIPGTGVLGKAGVEVEMDFRRGHYDGSEGGESEEMLHI